MALMMLRLGNITSLLSKIRPAVEKANSSYKGNKSSKNDDFMDTVCHFNVHISIDEIITKSPILKEMEELNEIMIVGAIYNMKTGKVDFL